MRKLEREVSDLTNEPEYSLYDQWTDHSALYHEFGALLQLLGIGTYVELPIRDEEFQAGIAPWQMFELRFKPQRMRKR